MDPKPHPPLWPSVAAFAILYLVWGSTFLAIRVGVAEVPPFLLAGIRFVIAGAIMYAWMAARGEPSPTPRQWASTLLLGVLIFVVDYGFVFWAEQRVPSGVTAVMMATAPVFMALFEITILRTRHLTARLTAALLIGLSGVAALAGVGSSGAIDRVGALALLIASVSWSFSSVMTRKLPLPSSKLMSSASQMLTGGVLLTITAGLLGEFRDFRPLKVSTGAWLSLAYLIVAGSIMAFTAYLWLLHHYSVTVVATHSYVNPVIAVLLGYFMGGEALGVRTAAGTALVLSSILLIARARQPRSAA